MSPTNQTKLVGFHVPKKAEKLCGQTKGPMCSLWNSASLWKCRMPPMFAFLFGVTIYQSLLVETPILKEEHPAACAAVTTAGWDCEQESTS